MQEAGGRRQEEGGRRQEAGGRRQGAGVRRQEAGRHSISRFFCAVKTLVLTFCGNKVLKNVTKNHFICVKNEEKDCKRG